MVTVLLLARPMVVLCVGNFNSRRLSGVWINRKGNVELPVLKNDDDHGLGSLYDMTSVLSAMSLRRMVMVG